MEFEQARQFIEKAATAKEPGRRLSVLEQKILKGSYEGKGYEEIASEFGCTTNYLKGDAGPALWKAVSEWLGERVTKKSFRVTVERKQKELGIEIQEPLLQSQLDDTLTQQSGFKDLPALASKHTSKITYSPYNWSEAPDISSFRGREKEQELLKRWIIDDECRLVTLFGLNGMGKTALAVKVSQEIKEKFEYIIWRSLRQAPSINNLLGEILQLLPSSSTLRHNQDTNNLISGLIKVFQKHRCLLILDNLESILQSGKLVGQYREDYQWYGELFRRVGETPHKSCLLLTSLEKPRGITKLEGNNLPIRSLHLEALKEADARAILQEMGLADENKWNMLIQFYQGNPLALKIVAATIKELLNGQVQAFLDRGSLVFGEICDLLDEPFNRLSNIEKEIIYWLAITNQPVSLTQLEADFWLTPDTSILESMTSLRRRSLVEISLGEEEPKFFLQEVVRQYVTKQLVEQISAEISQLIKTGREGLEKTKLLKSLNLTQSLEVTKEKSLISQIADRLRSLFRSESKIVEPLVNIREKLPQTSTFDIGYARDNIDQLLQELNAPQRQEHELLHQSLVSKTP